jgi:hypothetical protein
MHTARADHAAVYHSQYLYVLGGQEVSKCERFLCAERRWEVLPDLPVACTAMSAVELDNSVYVLGGYSRGYLDTVLKLSLDSLTWKQMRVKLPRATSWFPCFTTDTQVYLQIKETLYSFTPFEVKLIKTLPKVKWCISSYYSRGTLYYSAMCGEIRTLDVGELA